MKKEMNAGLHGGLFEWDHIMRMGGSAMGLFGWCVLRQTRRNGLVLGGKVLTYEYITADLKAPAEKVRTIKRWMATLISEDYIDVKRVPNQGMILTILNPKKHGCRQLGLGFESAKKRTLKEDDESAQSRTLKQNESAKKRTLPIQKSALSNTKHRTPYYIEPVRRAINETPELERATPDGIAGLVPLPLWHDFVQVRASKHKPTTPAVILLIIGKLLEYQAAGDDPITVVEQSVVNHWADIFPLKKENGSNGNGYRRISKEQQRSEENDRLSKSMQRGYVGLAERILAGVSGDVDARADHRLPDSANGSKSANPAQGVSASDEVIDVQADPGGSASGGRHRIRGRAKAETA